MPYRAALLVRVFLVGTFLWTPVTLLADQTCWGSSYVEYNFEDWQGFPRCMAFDIDSNATSYDEGGGNGSVEVSVNVESGCGISVGRYHMVLRIYDRHTTALLGTFETSGFNNPSGLGFSWSG